MHIKILAAALLAVSGFVMAPAHAAPNWVGTADYRLGPGASGDEEIVGPFDTYDFARGVVLVEDTTATTGADTYNGYYQSFVTNHQLGASIAVAPGLNSNYEVTVTAWFEETANSSNGTFDLTDGGVKLWFDTTPDYNFNADSGFTDGGTSDGGVILTGTIISGSGALFTFPDGRGVGFTDLTVRVDSYDTTVFEPDTIAAGSSIFTLRLNDSSDATFLDPITSVMGHTYDGSDVKLAADGYLVLQVPEAKTYAMMLAGLGLIGMMVSRSRRRL